MTRKDYVRFAAMLKVMRAMNRKHSTVTPTTMCYPIADIFAADNPRFDRVRFLKACGVES